MSPRAVKLSKTFNNQLIDQIDFGERRFGRRVAEQKNEKVLATIAGQIAVVFFGCFFRWGQDKAGFGRAGDLSSERAMRCEMNDPILSERTICTHGFDLTFGRAS
jgi:hypothetical protein